MPSRRLACTRAAAASGSVRQRRGQGDTRIWRAALEIARFSTIPYDFVRCARESARHYAETARFRTRGARFRTIARVPANRAISCALRAKSTSYRALSCGARMQSRQFRTLSHAIVRKRCIRAQPVAQRDAPHRAASGGPRARHARRHVRLHFLRLLPQRQSITPCIIAP